MNEPSRKKPTANDGTLTVEQRKCIDELYEIAKTEFPDASYPEYYEDLRQFWTRQVLTGLSLPDPELAKTDFQGLARAKREAATRDWGVGYTAINHVVYCNACNTQATDTNGDGRKLMAWLVDVGFRYTYGPCGHLLQVLPWKDHRTAPIEIAFAR